MNSIIVVGVQWGDEGKGKMIDLLAEHAHHVVRAQGGNNAGHTIKIEDQEYRFHLIPSGILYPHVRCYIGGGTVIDPQILIQEMEELQARGIKLENRLFLSPYVHLIFPYHKILDKLYEEQKGSSFIGTTGRGIGPCYADKALGIGIPIGKLLNPKAFKVHLEHTLHIKNQELKKVFNYPEIEFNALFASYLSYAEKLSSYIASFEKELNDSLEKGVPTLFEGAHGSLLDTTFGTYPFVTSSGTLSGAICAGAGIGVTKIHHTLGVVKAYTTRVGNGPFPTEFSSEEMSLLDCYSAREVGTTTGRIRRMGWFDAVLTRFAMGLNGVDSIALTKLDVLDHLKEIKICTEYRFKGKSLETPPSTIEEFELIEPVYEILPGWETSTKDIHQLEDLPKNTRLYLERIEALCKTSVSILSLGPERHRTLFLRKFFGMQ